MSDDSLPYGATLGAFSLEGRVGQGGMGTVYRARNRITGEARAVKLVRPEHAANDELRARFVREMRLASAVDHPNVVRVYEPSMEGDTLILPMEFVEGITLRAHLRTGDGASRRLGPDEALALAIPLCEGVGALHALGVVHRDLKPPNVMLVRSPEGALVPKVLDLGAALDLSGSDEATRDGLVVGTPAYMPFEQAAGRRDLDARVDVYALGVILYEMLAGRRPYDGDDSQSVLAKVIQRLPFPALSALAPEVDRGLATLVARTLAHDREERPADARALADALRDLRRATHAADAVPLESDSAQIIVEQVVLPPRASRAGRIVAGALAVLAAALAVAAAVRGEPPVAPWPTTPRALASPTPPREAPPASVIAAIPVEQPLVAEPATAVLVPSSASDASVDRVTHRRAARRRCRPRPGVICPPEGDF